MSPREPITKRVIPGRGTALFLYPHQHTALKKHLEQYRYDLDEKDRKDFDCGPLGEILSVL